MTKITIIILSCIYFCSLPLRAQSTPITLRFGADAYGAAKYPNGSFTVLANVAGGNDRVGLHGDFKPNGVAVGQFTYAARARAEHVLVRGNGVELYLIGQAGVASAPNQVGVIISGGGGLAVPTKKLKGWQPNISAEAESFPASGSPTLSLCVSFGKTFGVQ